MARMTSYHAVRYKYPGIINGTFDGGLTLCGAKLPAEILWRGFLQPIGIHQAQIPHVTAGRVQELIKHHVCWFGLEQDGGRMDRHGLLCVQSDVTAFQLQLRSVHEQSVSQTATDIHQV